MTAGVPWCSTWERVSHPSELHARTNSKSGNQGRQEFYLEENRRFYIHSMHQIQKNEYLNHSEAGNSLFFQWAMSRDMPQPLFASFARVHNTIS
jgi:hypothetical protein